MPGLPRTDDPYILSHFKGKAWMELVVDGIAPYRIWRVTGQRDRRVRGWSGWRRLEHDLPPIRQILFFVCKDTLDPIQRFVRLKDAREFARLLATGEDAYVA